MHKRSRQETLTATPNAVVTAERELSRDELSGDDVTSCLQLPPEQRGLNDLKGHVHVMLGCALLTVIERETTGQRLVTVSL